MENESPAHPQQGILPGQPDRSHMSVFTCWGACVILSYQLSPSLA